MRKALLVTGATGCIGRAVVKAALLEGWQVRGFARSAKPDFWPRDAQYIAGSVEDRDALSRAVIGCESIVHLAGFVHAVPSRRGGDQVWSSVVEGTRNVVDAGRRYGARVVLSSSAAVYGTPPPAVCDERTPTRPKSLYAVAKLESERVVSELGEQATVLRLCAVYGNGDRGNVASLIAAADRGFAVVVGQGSNRKSLLYSDNLADRIMRVLADPNVNGTWCVSDMTTTQRELMEEIASAVGGRRLIHMPLTGANLLAQFRDVLPGTTGRLGSWRQRIATLASSTELRGDAFDTRLRYVPRTSIRDALKATVFWQRQSMSKTAART